MKKVLAICLLLVSGAAIAQNAPASAPALKSILLEQLKTTHNVEDWFVPVNIAIQDLTPEQAAWKDSTGNHSIVQLVNHIIFWDLDQLAKFKGEKQPPFNGDNTTTFTGLDKGAWDASVKRVDSVLTAWEVAIQAAPESKLQKWYSTIAHIGTHNAYHTGQIIYIRKMRGNWNPDKGVK